MRHVSQPAAGRVDCSQGLVRKEELVSLLELNELLCIAASLEALEKGGECMDSWLLCVGINLHPSN